MAQSVSAVGSGAGEPPEPQYTLGTQFILQLAASHVQSAGKSQIDGGNVLAALFRDRDSHAVYFLQKQNISRLDVLRYISHGISKMESESEGVGTVEDAEGEDEERRSRPRDPLAQFCVNLNEKAAQGRIDPLIGRAAEVERAVHILARRRKNNPIFLGDAGVGKTAIVEGLALRIHQGDVPACLKTTTIYGLDMGGLLAGTKYRGDFEERMTAVIQAIMSESDNRILWFVGVVLNDPLSAVPRPVAVAFMDRWRRLRLRTWTFDPTGNDLLSDTWLEEGLVVAIDGPQGLAGEGKKMRDSERLIRESGRTDSELPRPVGAAPESLPGSVQLFAALRGRGLGLLLEAPDEETVLLEVYPGDLWSKWLGKKLPKKATTAGRRARWNILKGLGFELPLGPEAGLRPAVQRQREQAKKKTKDEKQSDHGDTGAL